MIDPNKKFYLNGQLYNVEDYINKFFSQDILNDENGIETVFESLETSGRLKWIDETPLEVQNNNDIIEAVAKEEAIIAAGKEVEERELAEKQFELEKQRENKLTYSAYILEFPTLPKAQEFEKWVKDNLMLETLITIKGELIELEIHDLTEKDMSKINIKYGTQRAVKKTLNLFNKTATVGTEVAETVASDIIVPTVQVGTKVVANMSGIVAKTSVKTASTVFNSTIEEGKKVVEDLKNDDSLKKAIATITEAKQSIRRKINNRKSHSLGRIIQ